MKTPVRFLLFMAVLTGFLFIGCEPTDETTSEDDPRDPYVGVWQFIENSKSTEGQSYIVTISKDPANSGQVILQNFGNPGTPDASVTGLVTSNQIIVTSQVTSNNWTVEGTGKISNSAKTTMAWTYSLLIGADLESHTATATRQ
jgi:hypothetical protein